MIILNVKSALFYYAVTRDSGSRKPRFYLRHPQYSLRVYESDVTEWLPGWPENLKQAVKYEGHLR